MSDDKQLAINTDHGINLNMGFLIASTLQDAIKISEIIAKSGVCPTAYKDKPNDVLVALQMGAEVGLKPMQALQNIAVINGRPTLWGDAMLAICRQSKQFEYIKETFDEARMMYTCIVKRRNEPEFIGTFSQRDAETAKLWGNNTWAKYPKRMLQMRARGFALRDSFPDLLRGIITAEEASDYDEPKVDHSRAVGEIVEGQAVAQQTLLNSEQLEILRAKIVQSNSDEAALCKFAGIEQLEQMGVTIWPNIIRKLDIKIAKAKKEAELAALAHNKNGVDSSVAEFFDTETGEITRGDQVAEKI